MSTGSGKSSYDIDSSEVRVHAVTNLEKDLSLWETMKIYRWATFWSFVMCCTIIMDGYDGNMVPSFYALPVFQKKYGVQLPSGDWTIEAKWQTAFLVGVPIGRIIGGLGVALLADKFGRKKVTIGSLACMIGITFLVFFATGKEMLCAGWVISGVIWGVFNTMAPTYVSEVCPIKLRSLLVAIINLSWVAGQFISTGVVTGTSTRTDDWAYRVPLAVQWAFPVILIPLLCFAPESPWWHVRRGDIEKARNALSRLADGSKIDLDAHIQHMIQTDNEEDKSGTFAEIFKGSDLHRTEICAMAYAIQPLSGANIINFFAFFFQLTGIPQDIIFKLTLGLTGLGFLATLLSSIPLARLGRRTVMLSGLFVLTVTLFAMGILGCFSSKGTNWATAILLFVWTGTYDLSVGPVAFVIYAESSSVRLRSKSIAFASVISNLVSLIFNIAVPYMLNEGEANMRGLVGFVYGPICVLCFIWVWFRLPELKGLSYMEADRLFQGEKPEKLGEHSQDYGPV
uniref:Putative Sugar Porter n=1 Tax=Yarrowia yakushimensis TaxID=1527289 RepID=A0A1N6MBZ6_9ASCO|nr:putative Sugar Porter [Yarrowia yakushimensis]